MTPKKLILAFAIILMACVPLLAIGVFSLSTLLQSAPLLLFGLGMALDNKSYAQDYGTKVTKALPNGAASIYTDGIDLGHSTNGRVPPGTEILITAPALANADLGDGATMIYFVQMDTDSAFGSPTSIYGTVLTQTGASGAGAAAATKRVALPSDCERYVRVGATNSAAGDASDKSVIVNVIFPMA